MNDSYSFFTFCLFYGRMFVVKFMKILLTCFKPFHNDTLNSSLELLNHLDDKYKDHEIKKLVLDVIYEEDGNKVIEEIKKYQPNIVLSLGQAKGRSKVTLEVFAVNARHSKIADNKETYHFYDLISTCPAYATKLNVKKIKNHIREEFFDLSFHAGTFVCNDVYYKVLKYLEDENLNILYGFIHLPCIKEQVTNEPYMELPDMKNIIYQMIDIIMEDVNGEV